MNHTKTTALARYTRPSHCPARAPAKLIEMHLLCRQFAEEDLDAAHRYPTEVHRAWFLRNAADWYARAGAYLTYAVELSRPRVAPVDLALEDFLGDPL